MAADRKIKKDKEIVLEAENAVRDIQQQLNDQLKCLDQRLDCHVGLLFELQDFYRMQGEVEREVVKGLDKLLKQISARHKAERQRRETWKTYTTYRTWEMLQEVTRRQSRDHAALAEIYGQIIFNKLGDIMDDLQRINKRCRDMTVMSQVELGKVLGELVSALKSYHMYHEESQQSETKLIRVQSQRLKADQQSLISRKFRNYEKESEKKQLKYTERKQKATKARNEYLLCIDAANAALQKYFTEDIPQLMKKMEDGYHVLLRQILTIHVEAEQRLIVSNQDYLQSLMERLNSVEGSSANLAALRVFSLPTKFEFQPHRGDEIRQLYAPKAIHDDMLSRMIAIRKRLDENKVESEMAANEMSLAEHLMMEKITVVDWDVLATFNDPGNKSASDREKKRMDRTQAEDSYFAKYHNMMRIGNVTVRLKARLDSLVQAVGEYDAELRTASTSSGGSSRLQFGIKRPPSLPPKPKRMSYAVVEKVKHIMPKLFGGSTEEYYKATGEVIPSIVLSCIRMINLYGMHHQGIFRVSGSQSDINNFKNEFDKGLDPLSGMIDGDDINSVAGLLKLYFRELKEPLFPLSMFEELIHCSQSYNISDKDQEKIWTEEMRAIIYKLPERFVINLRYLFAFLNHVTEFSDENMMDAYNLAICFGPTLIPVPEGQDLVQVQAYVNELVKNIIIHHETLFPSSITLPGCVYEKCIASDELDREVPDLSMSDDDLLGRSAVLHEGNEDDSDNSDDEWNSSRSRTRTAVAQFKFEGRLPEELSFEAGDILTLKHRISADWWKGTFNGKTGRIPSRYIEPTRVKGRSSSSSTNLKLAEGLNRSTECLMTIPSSQAIHASQPNLSLHDAEAVRVGSYRKGKTRGRISSGASDDSGKKTRESGCSDTAEPPPAIIRRSAGRKSQEIVDNETQEVQEGATALQTDSATAHEELERLEAKVLDNIELLDRRLIQELHPALPEVSSKPDLITDEPARPDLINVSTATQPDLISSEGPRERSSNIRLDRLDPQEQGRAVGRPEPPLRTTPVGSSSEDSRRSGSSSEPPSSSETLVQITRSTNPTKVVESCTSFESASSVDLDAIRKPVSETAGLTSTFTKSDNSSASNDTSRKPNPDSDAVKKSVSDTTNPASLTSTFRSAVPQNFKGAAAASSSDVRSDISPSSSVQATTSYRIKSSTLPHNANPSDLLRSSSPLDASASIQRAPRSESSASVDSGVSGVSEISQGVSTYPRGFTEKPVWSPVVPPKPTPPKPPVKKFITRERSPNSASVDKNESNA